MASESENFLQYHEPGSELTENSIVAKDGPLIWLYSCRNSDNHLFLHLLVSCRALLGTLHPRWHHRSHRGGHHLWRAARQYS